MKWLTGCLLVLAMVSSAFAGEDVYIAVVSNDIDANTFYLSDKHQQFLYDQAGVLSLTAPVCFGSNPIVIPQTKEGGLGCEQFRSNKAIDQPEICDAGGSVFGFGDFQFFGNANAVVRKQNAGWFEWWVRLPKKPSGEINLVFQCGVLKPNTFAFEEFNAIKLCAAETGERIGTGFCTRNQVAANVNPIVNSSLPKITAIAYPGPQAIVNWKPFRLTAYKNPGTYALSTKTNPDTNVTAMVDSAALQVLDGSANARILLKACLDKSVVAKIPVTGQINALGDVESDLEAGDLIQVRMDIPINNTVDVYCHSQSLRLAGVGESPF